MPESRIKKESRPPPSRDGRTRSATATQPNGCVHPDEGITTLTVTTELAPGRADILRHDVRPSCRQPSPNGTSRGRFEALAHRQPAGVRLLLEESPAEFERRLDVWIVEQDPRDDLERVLVRRALEIACDLDRLRAARQARGAAFSQADADRRAAQAEEAVVLGRRLYFDPVGPLCLYPHSAAEPRAAGDRLTQLEDRAPRAASASGEPERISYSRDPEDPDDPARLVVRLESMTLGCAWLLDRWAELKDLLEEGLVWLPHDRLKAVRMLGRQPLDAIDDQRVMAIYLNSWALDRTEEYEFTDQRNELAEQERSAFVRRINARERPGTDTSSPEAARSALLALIVAEEERLEAILEGHLEREKAEAQAEWAFDASHEGERIRKHELALDRELLRIIETLRKRHKEAGATASPGRRTGSAVAGDRASLGSPAAGHLTAAATAAAPGAAAGDRASLPAEAAAGASVRRPDPDGSAVGGTSGPRPDPSNPTDRWTQPALTTEFGSAGIPFVGPASLPRSDPTDRRTEPAPTADRSGSCGQSGGPGKSVWPGPARRAAPAAIGLTDEPIRAAPERITGAADLVIRPPHRCGRTIAPFEKPAARSAWPAACASVAVERARPTAPS
jgi:hypothetical protein